MASSDKSENRHQSMSERAQRRFDALFPDRDSLPAPMNMAQAEALRLRIAELEVRLANQRVAAEAPSNQATSESTAEMKAATSSSSTRSDQHSVEGHHGDPRVTKQIAEASRNDIAGEEFYSSRWLTSMLAVLLGALVLISVTSLGSDTPILIFLGILSALIVASLVFVWKKIYLPARIIVPFAFLATLVFLSVTGKGIYDGGVLALSIFIAVSILIWGKRAPFISGILSLIGLAWIAYQRGVFNNPTGIEFGDYYTFSIILVVNIGILQVLVNRLESTSQRAQNKNALEDLNRELISLKASLEKRVEQRTQDLMLAAQVARTVSETTDLYELLYHSVELIRDRYNLHYTQIYLIDANTGTLVLKAGTGSVGAELLRRGHKLLLDARSINGKAAAEKRTVIVPDTSQNPSFLPNPLLPDTRSEMAIPLIVNGSVVGVLDLQSERVGSLNETNLPAFEALAGQLAVAVQNAYLYTEVQEAHSELETQIRDLTEKGWREFLDAIERGQKIGYAFDQTHVLPLEEGAITLPPTQAALTAPIALTGMKLGTIQLTPRPDHTWSEPDREVTRAVAAQLAQHIDNLRLLAQAEKYRKEAEHALRRLTRQGWDALQVRNDLAPGYIFDSNEVRPWIEDRNGHGSTGIKHPLLVRDQPIGEMAVEGSDSSDEARAIVAAVARQLSGHIENLRLSQEIEKRAYELATVADVSTTASTLLDPDRLLQSVVDLAKNRFGLYHVHIYLVDESWQTLLLTAGAGEAGRQMMAEGWNIPMDHPRSIVAQVARTRKSVIANDVYHDKNSNFLSNRLLPNTRSELAVPMIVGDKLLGVFDVQSDVVGRFSDEDASIYTTLAAQVGVALQNARLYMEQAATVSQLRELDRLKSSFLANMSHELRTPLNSILGFADVMLEGLDGELTEYMDNDLRLIQKNGQHLLYLINDVLDMAKIESGRMNLNPERFNVHGVLEEVMGITSSLAGEKNLSILIDETSDREIEIFADNMRLRQVMINLVNNSIKFTEKGHILLCASPLDSARILITVEDTGIGIPPDQLEAIFQEFTQVDSSTTRKVGGTGLGLPISRRLVEMHGGRLWAESTGIPDQGSKFFVELPLEARITEIVEK